MKESAHIAYDAYGDFAEWKNFSGAPMPHWNDLPEKIQNAWRAACQALGHVQSMNVEHERLQVQLAGCGVAALGGTVEGQVAVEGQFGWSPAYADVLKLRRAFDKIARGRSPDDVLGVVTIR